MKINKTIKRLLRPLYYGCWEFLERHSFGVVLEEWRWRRKKFFRADFESWFRQSISEPHRAMLVERVLRSRPASVLEFGAYAGQNLYAMSERDSSIILVGLDINRQAVEAGRALFLQESKNSVRLLTVEEQPLCAIESDAYDVVMTDATLMYFGPNSIEDTLAELIRIARKGVVLSEWHLSGTAEAAGSRFVFGQWAHDFELLLLKLAPAARVSIEHYPKQCWGDVNWWTYGHLIEVTFPSNESGKPTGE